MFLNGKEIQKYWYDLLNLVNIYEPSIYFGFLNKDYNFHLMRIVRGSASHRQYNSVLNQRRLRRSIPYCFIYYYHKLESLCILFSVPCIDLYPSFLKFIFLGKSFIILNYPWQLSNKNKNYIRGILHGVFPQDLESREIVNVRKVHNQVTPSLKITPKLAKEKVHKIS